MKGVMKCAMVSAFAAAGIASAEGAVIEVGAIEESPAEEVWVDFYDGIRVLARRTESGDLTAFVTETVDDESRIRAQLSFDLAAKRGTFLALSPAETLEAVAVHDYTNRDGFDTEAALARHTPKSIAIAALLVWEDHLAAQAAIEAAQTPPPGYGQQCEGCTPNPNGCTGFFDSCGGASLVEVCKHHDTCYQCGMRCHGHSRAECDRGFRLEVRQTTGSPWCGWIYWLGVRGVGWLFFQNPSFRPPLNGDIYPLGIILNACPEQLYYLCTTYIL